MKEWKKVKLGEICKISAGGDRPSLVSEKETNYCQIPIYSNGIDNQGLYGFTNKAKIKGDAITITGRGANAGTVFYRKTAFYPIIRLLSLEPYNDIINPRYLYYLIKDRTFLSTGSAQPQITVPNISDYVISYNANIVDQQRIATILSRYDSLIENYQKQIKLLEESAQRLYKEWFIDLRFPGYENTKIVDGVPEGWEKGILDNIAYDSGKKVDKKYRENYGCYLPIDCLPKKNLTYVEYASILLAESSLVSFKKGDIIFGAMRPYFHKVCFAQSEGLTRTTCFVLNSRLHEYREYLLMLMFEDSTVKHATSISVGTTMPYTRWKDLKSMEILIPDKKTVVLFGKEIYKITEALQNFSSQIRHLTEARDRLLPKLMSGEIEV